MDKIRIVLVAAFVMVSFMLAVEFAKYKDIHQKEQVSEKYAQTQGHEHNIPTKGNAEVPSQEEPEKIPDTTLSNTKTLVKVLTDTLSVTIDPEGGDLVNIALPKHLARIDTPDIPFVLLENSSYRTYVAQSGLIGKNATDTADGRPVFKTVKTSYVLGNEEQIHVDLVLKQGDIDITKRFIFTRGSYLIRLEYLIRNNSNEMWEGAFYSQIKRDGSADPASENGGNMGMSPYLGFATTTKDERFKKIKFEDIEELAFNYKQEGGWIAMIQHYFLSAWIPDPEQEHEYSTIKSKNGFYLARIKSPSVSVAPESEGVISASFYAGPKDQYRLQTISQGLDLSVDYGVLWMIAQPLYALLYFFNKGELHAFGSTTDIFKGIGNWGFSIILLTLFVKACFFTLNAKAYNSMAKMRAIQPKMLEIRDRYADDRQQQSKEMMALYSKEGVNPLGGCLPILIQMPVFLALYWVLLESVELRHAPFIGYIHDLSSMDPYFIMPVIMGFSMFIQQKLNPPPPDPMQAKIMQFLPVIFTFFFAFFPSGLVLYWIVNNVLSIAQQWIITRRIEASINKQ